MSAPLKDKDCIIAIFDSFAKTVMKNECSGFYDLATAYQSMHVNY